MDLDLIVQGGDSDNAIMYYYFEINSLKVKVSDKVCSVNNPYTTSFSSAVDRWSKLGLPLPL
jgi:hypothetical protein